MLYPQTSTSYSGGPSWVLLPLIFETSATLPWEFWVIALSAQQSRVFFSSHLPTLQLCRITSFQLLASLLNGLSLALRLFPRIVSNSFYAHLKAPFWPYWNREHS